MLKKGLQLSAMTTRQNAKTEPKSNIFQRKRSRSEIGENVEHTAQTDGRPKVLFPERANVARKQKLPIDPNKLPRLSGYERIPEVNECFQSEMLLIEEEYAADPNYLCKQPQLNSRMRAVLLDWMFEVGQEYGLKRDTLHYSINFVDRFLSRQENPVHRSKLQLVGVTALWIASKMEEILPPPVSDFAAATDSGCVQAEIVEMEGTMLEALDWKLLPSTPFAFANLYLQILACNARRRFNPTMASSSEENKPWMAPSIVSPTQLTRVMEVLDLALLDIDSLCFPPSVLAATAVLSLLERANSDVFTADDVLKVARLSRSDVEDCMEWFSFALDLAPAPPGFQYRKHVIESTLRQELHIIQRHNPAAVLLFKEVCSRRQWQRHPAAERQLKKCRKESISISDDSDDDPELRRLDQVNKKHLNLIHMDSHRSFSPMTAISMTLEKTTFGSEPRTKNGVTMASNTTVMMGSPQRQIVFDF